MTTHGTSLIIAGSGPTASTANTVQYWRPVGPILRSATEAQAEIVFRTSGWLRNLTVILTANSISGGTTVFQLRKNTNTNLNQTVSFGASATGTQEDTTHDDYVQAGDRITLMSTPGASTGTFSVRLISMIFQADVNTVTKFASIAALTTFNTASTTSYIGFGMPAAASSEANAKSRFRKAGTLKNLAIYVASNRATTSTLRVRKNGTTDGNLVVSITGGGANGWYEDITDVSGHSDTVTVADDWYFTLTTGTGVDSLNVFTISCELFDNTGTFTLVTAHSTPVSVADAATRYFQVAGSLDARSSETGATGAQCEANGAFTVTEPTILVTANDVSSASTCRLRVGAANVNNTISITGSTPGLYADTTPHTDVLAAGSLINYIVTVPSVSGSHSISIAAITTAMTLTELTIVNQTYTHLYNIKNLIAQTFTHKYHIINHIAQTFTHKYHILNKIAQTYTHLHNIKNLIAQTFTHKYNIKNLISQIFTHKYHIKNLISQTFTHIYNILAQAIQVAQTFTHKYHIKNIVGSPVSVLLDGDNDYIDLGAQTGLWSQTLTKFSVSFWIKPNTADGDVIMAITDQDGLDQILIYVVSAGASLRAAIYTEFGNNACSSTFDQDVWLHVGLTYDKDLGSLNGKLFFDGQYNNDFDLTESIVMDSAAKMLIGGEEYSLGNWHPAMNVKDYRWWNDQALSEADMLKVKNDDPTAPTPDYWLRMDEGTGNPVDSIGDLTATLEQGATWAGGSPTFTHIYNINNLANQTFTHKYNIINFVSQIFTHKYNIQNLVSQTYTHIHNIKSLIAQTFTHKHNILNLISQTFTHKWNIINHIAQTFTHRYNILELISQTFTHKHNILNLVAQTYTHLYNIINHVSQTFTHVYNILGLNTVANTFTHIYNISNLASQNFTHKWNINNLIAQTFTHKHNILTLISQTFTHKWNILELAAQTFTHLYNLKNLIAQSFTHRYNILNSIANIFTHRYNIRGLISNTFTHIYNLRNLVANTFTHRWNIINFVSQIFTHKYHIINHVAQTFTHIYNILELGIVSNTFTHIYNITALTSQTYTHKYNLKNLIGQTFTHKYNIRNLVSQLFTHNYNIGNLVAQTFTHFYNILGLNVVSQTFTHIYNIANLTSQTYTHRWNIRNLIAQVFTHRHNILATVNQTFTHKYNILTLISQVFTHRYGIRNLVSQTFTHSYNIIAHVAQTFTHKWNILTFTAQTYTHRYNITKIAAQTFTHSYSINNLVGQIFIHNYNIWNLVSRIFKHIYNILTREGVSDPPIMLQNFIRNNYPDDGTVFPKRSEIVWGERPNDQGNYIIICEESPSTTIVRDNLDITGNPYWNESHVDVHIYIKSFNILSPTAEVVPQSDPVELYDMVSYIENFIDTHPDGLQNFYHVYEIENLGTKWNPRDSWRDDMFHAIINVVMRSVS